MKKLKEFLEDYKGWQIFFTRNTYNQIKELELNIGKLNVYKGEE